MKDAACGTYSGKFDFQATVNLHCLGKLRRDSKMVRRATWSTPITELRASTSKLKVEPSMSGSMCSLKEIYVRNFR